MESNRPRRKLSRASSSEMARFLDLPLACASLFRFMLVGSSARCGVGRRQRGLLIFSVPSCEVAAPPSRLEFPVSPPTSRLHPAGREAWEPNCLSRRPGFRFRVRGVPGMGSDLLPCRLHGYKLRSWAFPWLGRDTYYKTNRAICLFACNSVKQPAPR